MISSSVWIYPVKYSCIFSILQYQRFPCLSQVSPHRLQCTCISGINLITSRMILWKFEMISISNDKCKRSLTYTQRSAEHELVVMINRIQSPYDFTWINAMIYFYYFDPHIGGHFAALGSNWYSSTMQFPCYQGLYMNHCICPAIFH